ncbi:MAG: (2Fe-2S)-binding protein [Actinomycetota bacterium]|nr:(2Fe-2S)-binding protein [Actinomycetota bacterium]
MHKSVEICVNGATQRICTDPEKPLLFVLREDLGLTGAKIGCGEAECGVCTVLVGGEPIRSCVTPVRDVAGKKVLTIEGLAEGEDLHPLQQCFVECGALQCGYCTPGMIMSAVGLLRREPEPTTEEIVAHMQGNICRCGCYPRIVRAIEQAAGVLHARERAGGGQ